MHRHDTIDRITPTLGETLIWAAGIKRTELPAYRHYAREVNVRVYAIEKC